MQSGQQLPPLGAMHESNYACHVILALLQYYN